MKLLLAFLRLIRVLNLFFIALTQVLFYYCIVLPVVDKNNLHSPGVYDQLLPFFSSSVFTALVLSSVLIAAAGYIINDYFDLNIDLVNKPQKLVIEKIIKRRWAILWHMSISVLGIVISFYVSWKTGAWWVIFANIGCVMALWFYSTTFKKKLLTGNLIISVLTAWVILVIGFLINYKLSRFAEAPRYVIEASKLMRLTFLYSGFAFIISLIREVVKDLEDMPGDAKYGCKTMPIKWGVNAAKVFAATWLVVLVTILVIVMVYVLPFQWWWPALYGVVLVIFPLLYILRKLYSAKTGSHYHSISNWLKFAMLTGILSMIFFKIYS
jgi:4-hydroxybenzoate polyprenyltransferase